VKIIEDLLPKVEGQSVNGFLQDYTRMVRDRLSIWNNKPSSLAKKLAVRFPELADTDKQPISPEGPVEQAVWYIDYVSRSVSRRIADVVEPLIHNAGFIVLRRGYNGFNTWVNFRSLKLEDFMEKYGKGTKLRDVVYAVEITPESVMFKLSVYWGNDNIKKLLWDFFHPGEKYKSQGAKTYVRLDVMTAEQLASNTGALDIQELTNFVNEYKKMTQQFEEKFDAWVAVGSFPQHSDH